MTEVKESHFSDEEILRFAAILKDPRNQNTHLDDGMRFLTEELQKPENAAWVAFKSSNALEPLYDEGYLTVEEFMSLATAQVNVRMGCHSVGKPLCDEAVQNFFE